jgi:outer membrane receptor protein involved in Fe transport
MPRRSRPIAACLALLAAARLASAEEEPARPSGEIEEIVVTASKKNELASDVPGSVSAIAGAELDQIGAASFQDFATYLPGVSSASRGVGENQVVVRGVTTGTQTSSTVGIYVDELPVGSSSAFAFGVYGLDVGVFDLDRVELLSGPQGTLYGASSLGGLLKYVTAPPILDEWAATLQGEAGWTRHSDETSLAGRAMVNVPFRLPVVDVPFAIRMTGVDEESAGFVDAPLRAAEDVDGSQRLGGRISLLGELAEGLEVRAGVLEQEITRDGATTVDYDPHTKEPALGDTDQQTRIPEPFDNRFLQYSGTVHWSGRFGDLTSASGWQDTDIAIAFDQTPVFGAMLGTGDAVPYRVGVGAGLHKLTQEVRFAPPPLSIFDGRIGGFFTDERAGSIARLTAEDTGAPPQAPPILDARLFTKYREAAFFGDVTAHLVPDVDLTVGARYAANHQRFRQVTTGVLGTIPSDTSPKESSENVVTWLVNPRWEITEAVMVYGRFASGYRPGGPNFIVPPPLPPQPPTYDADTVWNYELGAKTILFERVTFDADVFWIDWQNIQLLVNRNSLNTIENGGSARVVGGDIVSSLRVATGLLVAGNVTFARSELTEDVPGLEARDGQPLPLSPRVSGALTTTYDAPLLACCKTDFGASLRHVGRRPSGFDGSTVHPQYWLDGYHVIDLRAGFGWKAIELGLSLRNLFDERGGISADAAALQYDPDAPVRVTVTQPRTLGLTLTVRM